MTAPTWDLDALYSGGLDGAAFRDALHSIESRADELVQRADRLPPLPGDLGEWVGVLEALAAAREVSGRVALFAGCHACADTEDGQAALLNQRAQDAAQRLDRAWTPLRDSIARATAEAYEALRGRPELDDWGPMLDDIRRKETLLLPRGEAELAAELSRDGIAAWNQLYDRVSGRLKVRLADGTEVSTSRAQNLLSSPEAVTRSQALAALEHAWDGVKETCAAALTHVVGTRQVLNDRRGVDELADTLATCRMERATLEALLEAAADARPLLERYSAAKARRLGQDSLAWQDQTAPLSADSSVLTWAEAADFVVTHFGGFHPELSAFAREALEGRWIEAEDRDGKRPGGWCASIADTGDSRIFMTFGGSFRSMTTLAHELGHAYHNRALKGVHWSRRAVPSTLAETASVMAENIVRDAALEAARSDAERLALLDARLQAGMSFLMNIPARFHFERRLHEMRRKGPFDPDALSEVMVECQRQAYGDAVSTWNPLFWAGKLHFYMSGRAFYNFPYAFGYMFSSLVHARARAEGPVFHDRYLDLLRRTGWQDAEPLARETLGIDLTQTKTWSEALEPLRSDLEAFLALVDA